MKSTLFILIISFAFHFDGFTQDKKQLKGKFIYASSLISFYPKFKPYVITDYKYDFRSTIETSEIPSQFFNIGAGFRISNEKTFHEISLTRLIRSKGAYKRVDINGDPSLPPSNEPSGGNVEKTTILGTRYEIGKFLSKNKMANFRFGLSASIEPSLYVYRRTPYSTQDLGFKVNLVTLDFGITPFCSLKLSNNISLDFKLIPNLRLVSFGTAQSFGSANQRPEKPSFKNNFDVNVGGSVQVRYLLKSPKKGTRRK